MSVQDNTAPVVTETVQAQETPVAAEPVTISFRVSLSRTEEEAMRMIADTFNRENRSGITVRVVNETAAEEEEAQLPEETEAPEETAVSYALAMMDVQDAKNDAAALPVNDRIGMEFDNYQDVPENLRAMTAVSGSLKGVPFDVTGSVFFYNRTLFEEYGLEAPDTWELLQQAATTLAGEEDLPVTVTDHLTGLADMLLRQNGSALTEGNRAAFADNRGRETFAYLMELINGDGLLLADRGTCRDLFLEGRCAGYIGDTTDYIALFRNEAFETGACSVPAKENAAAPCHLRVLVLYAGEKNEEDAAWEFIRYLTNPGNNALWAVATGRQPVRKSAYQIPSYITSQEYNPAAQAASSGLETFYLPETYSEDLQYRVREIIGRNSYTEVSGEEVCDILVQEINDSLNAE